ncbi:polyprenyl synthetase family protein [Niallia sp. 01092]|uniref:polyprenyl synthetase family protein n=1 Tax=unclassified Niallia TaxID=2837522 RepID=UPI003FCF89DD
MNIKKSISTYLHGYLNNDELDKNIQQVVYDLLHIKGKIFNDETYFTWSEFFYYASSIFLNEDVHQQKKIAYAGAVEFLILATDIIDDIVDNDSESEILTKLPTPKALTISNVLLMESLYLFLQYSKTNTIQEFYSIICNLRTAAMGQWKDISFTISQSIPTEADYFALIKQKSVSLVRLIFELHHLTIESRWDMIATHIGIAGQLKNDAKDILIESKSDLINKKATLPLIKALEFSKEKDQDWLLKTILQMDSNNKDLIKKIRNYIQKTGAIDYCLILSKLHINKAIALLKNQSTNNKSQMEALIKYLDR